PEYNQGTYDQPRCFGTDWKFAPDAKALVMSSKKNTKEDIGQSSGRMRGWGSGQMVEIAYPEGIKEEIFVNKEQKNQIVQLLTYWLTNQTRKKEESNYHSQGQQMENEIRRPILDKILGLKVGERSKDDISDDDSVDVDAAIGLFGTYKKV